MKLSSPVTSATLSSPLRCIIPIPTPRAVIPKAPDNQGLSLIAARVFANKNPRPFATLTAANPINLTNPNILNPISRATIARILLRITGRALVINSVNAFTFALLAGSPHHFNKVLIPQPASNIPKVLIILSQRFFIGLVIEPSKLGIAFVFGFALASLSFSLSALLFFPASCFSSAAASSSTSVCFSMTARIPPTSSLILFNTSSSLLSKAAAILSPRLCSAVPGNAF